MKKTTSKKILNFGIIMLIVGVTLMVLGGTVFKDATWTLGWKPNFALFIPGMFIAFLALPVIFTGLSPKISGVLAQVQKEVQTQNEEVLTDVVTKTAEISAPGVTKIARAVKEGLGANDEIVFCSSCGKQIEKTSKYCKHCGSKQ